MSYESHKELGYEIMLMLQSVFAGSTLFDINNEGLYQKLFLEGGCSIHYTKWRNPPLPFYVILYNSQGEYIFEMDLSMVICKDDDKYQWNFKVPANKKTLSVLKDTLGEKVEFSNGYSAAIKEQKELLKSGVNTPRNGFLFLKNASWNKLSKELAKLINAVFVAHKQTVQKTKDITEAIDDNGDTTTQLRRIRRGQRNLRRNLLRQYDNKCAITGYAPTEVLEAAHIVNHSVDGINHSDNGILLRADIHSLFDSNLLNIDPKTMKVVISTELKNTPYWELNGKMIRKRIDETHPDSKYFEKRWLLLNQ